MITLRLATKALYDSRRGILGWSLGLIGLLTMQFSIYPSVRHEGERFREITESYPGALKALFNIGEDFTSGSGYLAAEVFSFTVPLILIGLAVTVASMHPAGEEERGLVELLLANPIRRRNIIAAAGWATLASTLAAGIVLFGALVIGTQLVNMTVGVGRLAETVIHSVVLAVVFGMLSLLIGVWTARRGAATGWAIALAAASYLVESLSDISDKLDNFRWLSMFHYASPSAAITGDADWFALLIPIGIGIAALVAAIIVFDHRDIAAK